MKLKIQVIIGVMMLILGGGYYGSYYLNINMGINVVRAAASTTTSSRFSDIFKNGLVPCGHKDSPPDADATNVRPDDTCTLADIFKAFARFTNFLIGLAGAFVVFKLVDGAFALATTYGNEQAITAAKGKMANAFWGFLLVLVAYTLVFSITNILLAVKGSDQLLNKPTDYIQTKIPSGENGQ